MKKKSINIILECAFGYSIIMVRLKHEYERGCAVLVEHIMSCFPLCIFWKNWSLILCLNELILFVDFKPEDRLVHIFGPM